MTRRFRAGTSGNGNNARTAARWSFDSGSRGRCSVLRAEMLRFPSSRSGQFGADAIAHAALLDPVALPRQIRELASPRAARSAGRMAANLAGPRRPPPGEPALELERQSFEPVRLDRAGRCL